METVEVRGVQGELIGYFSPACPETARLYAEAAARLNAQELSRRRLAHEPALAEHYWDGSDFPSLELPTERY